MFGLESSLASPELRIVASLAIAGAAILLTIGVRRLRPMLGRVFHPITIDFFIATVTVALVIFTALAIADIWGQTAVLFEQLAFLQPRERAPEIILTLAIIITILVMTSVTRRLLTDVSAESDVLTEHQQEIGFRFVFLGLWAAGALVIMGVWEIDLTGLLVGAGFLGIVLGFAARKTLGSMIAGVMLMFSRPFEVGEWIAVGGEQGVVTDITLMSSRLRSRDGERIVVPNDVIIGEIIINRSREGRLRIELPIGIDYADDVGEATTIAQEVATELANQDGIVLDTPSPSVLVSDLADSAVTLSVRVWVDAPTGAGVRQTEAELRRRIKQRFDETGITIPYPQRTISARESVDDRTDE